MKLGEKLMRLDKEITDLVRSQTASGQDSLAELVQAKQGMEDLYHRIMTIRNRARESEEMVKDMTKDIKLLDMGKRNLTATITMLKRLQMLTAAVEQLKDVALRKQHQETAQLLQAILQLLSHFSSYKSIKEVAVLWEQVDGIQADLRRRIFNDFENCFHNPTGTQTDFPLLHDACILADAIQRDAPRRQLMDWYCDLQLKEYHNIFRGNDEVAALDNTSRRYAWLKRALKQLDQEHASIFPPSWKMPEAFCERFCDDTRKDLMDVLTRSKAQNRLDINEMLQVLQLTLDFESKLNRRFSAASPEGVSLDLSRKSEDGRRSVEEAGSTKFTKRISVAFEPFLSHYITSQDKTLADMMDGYRKTTGDEDAAMQVFSSSTDLFYFYRQTLLQCAKLSTRQPFLDLFRLFGKWLKVYTEVLQTKLPGEKKALTVADGKTGAYVINTADYCQTTTSQLEDKLKEKIDVDLKDKISFAPEREAFMTLILTTIKVLVRGVENALEPAWASMQKINWAGVNGVGDQSHYISMMDAVLISLVPSIRNNLGQTKYFRTFCDKLTESIANRLLSTIYKLKHISEVGAEQLLLDVSALKKLLLNMPNVSMETPPAIPSIYIKLVTQRIAKSENLLKILMTPLQPLDGLMDTYLILSGTDIEASSFAKVLELKGVAKQDVAGMVEAFQRKTAGKSGPRTTAVPLASPRQPSPSSTLAPTLTTSAIAAGFESVGNTISANLPKAGDLKKTSEAMAEAASSAVDASSATAKVALQKMALLSQTLQKTEWKNPFASSPSK
jgi:hypothetical protein